MYIFTFSVMDGNSPRDATPHPYGIQIHFIDAWFPLLCIDLSTCLWEVDEGLTWLSINCLEMEWNLCELAAVSGLSGNNTISLGRFKSTKLVVTEKFLDAILVIAARVCPISFEIIWRISSSIYFVTTLKR